MSIVPGVLLLWALPAVGVEVEEPASLAVGSKAAIERALQCVDLADNRSLLEEVGPPATLLLPDFRQEITVTDWGQDPRLLPDYRMLNEPPRGIGLVRGGPHGSPSFDEVSQTYWWER